MEEMDTKAFAMAPAADR